MHRSDGERVVLFFPDRILQRGPDIYHNTTEECDCSPLRLLEMFHVYLILPELEALSVDLKVQWLRPKGYIESSSWCSQLLLDVRPRRPCLGGCPASLSRISPCLSRCPRVHTHTSVVLNAHLKMHKMHKNAMRFRVSSPLLIFISLPLRV